VRRRSRASAGQVSGELLDDALGGVAVAVGVGVGLPGLGRSWPRGRLHQRLTGDRDLDILIAEFPQAGREAVVEAVVGGGEIGCDRDIRLIVGKIDHDFLVTARKQQFIGTH